MSDRAEGTQSDRRSSPGWGPIAFAAAIVVMAVVVAGSAPAVTGDPTVEVLVRVCLLVAVAAGTVVVLTPTSRGTGAPVVGGFARAWMIGALVGTFLAAGAALVLSGSGFPPLGVALDQGFRAASVTKYAHTVALVDFAYKGLPAFYPPLFFWVLGRASAWTGIEPYEMLKLGLLWVALVAPLCAVALWARVTRDWMITVAVAVSVLAFHDWYEPYAWLAAVAFVPWWLWCVLQVGADDQPRGRWTLVGGAAIGAAIVGTYYYCFFIGAVHLVLVLAFRRSAQRHDVPWFPRHVRRSAAVLGGVVALSAVYWLPLLVAIVTTPGARAMQNRYLDPASVPVPLPFLDFDLVGWCMLFGLGYLAVTAWRSQRSMALLTLLGAAYVWIAIGDVGILADFPLLTAKTVPLIDVVLLSGAAIGAVEGGRAVVHSPTLRARIGAHGLATGLFVGTIALVIALGSSAIDAIPYVKEQRDASVPTQLLDTFTRATRGRADDTVVLTDQEQLPEYLPVFVFNVWNAHYSNPAAQFDQRTRFLQRLAAEEDPAVFAAALAHNRYDDVESVALRRSSDQLPYTFIDDAFPRGVTQRTITFHDAQFDPAHFAARGSAELAVYVPRGRDPLAALTSAQRRGLDRRFAGDLDDAA